MFRPISVSIVVPDDSARINNNYLLVRDVRTTVLTNHESVSDLCQQLILQPNLKPDIVLLDLNAIKYWAFDHWFEILRLRRPNTKIVCISESQDTTKLMLALRAHPDGLILKDDVQVALATALLQAYHTGFVYTPRAVYAMRKVQDPHLTPRHRMESWQIHPDIQKRRYAAVFWLCIIEGISARVVAYELRKRIDNLKQPRWKDDTVEKYRSHIYEIVDDGFYDLSLLQVAIDEGLIGRKDAMFVGDEWAFHIVTQPPNRTHALFNQALNNNIKPFYRPYRV